MMVRDQNAETNSLEEQAFECVCSVLARILKTVRASDIGRADSIMDDLGLDSLRFVDLTLALEEGLGLDELPVQDWYDAESTRSGKRYSVASLVAFCAERMR